MKSLKQIIPLTVIMSVMVGVNYLQAAWSGPPGSAPNNNVDAPVNVGGTTQTKTGGLNVSGSFSAGSAVVDGTSLFNHDIQIGNDTGDPSDEMHPTIKFEDGDHRDWWLHVNGHAVYFIADRDDNGSSAGESPWPVTFWADPADPTKDWIRSSGAIRANEYCDYGGNNCFVSSDVSGGGSVGEGQTWQNVLASRSLGTSYQNTTGRAIQVCINGASSDQNIQVSTNNSTWVDVGHIGTWGVYSNGSCFVVPDTHYYRVEPGGGAYAPGSIWSELR